MLKSALPNSGADALFFREHYIGVHTEVKSLPKVVSDRHQKENCCCIVGLSYLDVAEDIQAFAKQIKHNIQFHLR